MTSMQTRNAALLQKSVFVSFSMPEELLQSTLKEAANLQIPAVLRGFHQGSMSDTMKKLFTLAKQIPHLGMQIDPELFERFSIKKVPAVVVSLGDRFDVVYGNVSIT